MILAEFLIYLLRISSQFYLLFYRKVQCKRIPCSSFITHGFVAKFRLIAINTAFQVCFLKTSWNGFMKSLCSFSDWTFAIFFSVNSRFSQVVAVLRLGSKYVDTVSALHFSTYVVGEAAKWVHNNLKSIREHCRKCHQGA